MARKKLASTFEQFVSRIVSVPKAKIDELEEAERLSRPARPKRGPKPKTQRAS